MISFSDPRQTLVDVHSIITGWQSLRERRRLRYTPPTASASAASPASMHSPPVSEASPASGPVGPEKPTLIAFHKLGDRIIPIYGDPIESGGAAGPASANAAPPPPEARTADSPAPPSKAAPEPSSTASPRSAQTPPPPDFSPQAVEASAPRPSPAALPTLDLPPPTPPPLIRAEEHAITLERVLADHRAQLAQHAAMLEVILAEHRRALAQEHHDHRQQFGELLSKHREEMQGVAATTGEHAQALVQLREFAAEQVSATQAEYIRIGEKIEDTVDIVGMVGETVHHLAAVVLQPKAPLFGTLPTRPITTPKAVNDQTTPPSSQPSVTGPARILPVRPPVQQASPVAAVAGVKPSIAAPVEPHGSVTMAVLADLAVVERITRVPPHTVAAVQVASTPPPDANAVPKLDEGDPAPRRPSPPACVTPAAAGRAAGSAPTELATSPPTPRQLRDEAAARERSRLDEAIFDQTLDDDTVEDEVSDG